MDKIKIGLGRGLSSLIGETKTEPQKKQVLISDLVPNRYQPRKIFDEASLEDLTNSIKERGMIQPIIVRNSNNDTSKFDKKSSSNVLIIKGKDWSKKKKESIFFLLKWANISVSNPSSFTFNINVPCW